MCGLLGSDNIWPRYNYMKIWNLRVQKNLNIEKIPFKVVQMKSLAMHITNNKLSFDIFTVIHLLNILERVSSFKYLGVNISEDLTWTTHIQTQVKKARQRLYHLRQLRKFRVSPAILKTFYSGAIESVLTLSAS